jgi:ATP-dependent DNA helicase 2 subunit 1
VIFLIDCSEAMFQPNERDEIPFNNAIKCVIATLTDKIISSENDLLGICFYCTVSLCLFPPHCISFLINGFSQKEKKNPNDFEGIYVVMDLDVPDAQKIMDLESLLNSK